MLNGKNNPKLRSKAGECRELVPFGAEISAAHLGSCEEHEAAKLCAKLLAQRYQCLSKDSFNKENCSATLAHLLCNMQLCLRGQKAKASTGGLSSQIFISCRK